MQDVISTFLEPMRKRMFVHQWLDLFVMFTMELSAAPQSAQVITCVPVPILFIFNIFLFAKGFVYQSLNPILHELE